MRYQVLLVPLFAFACVVASSHPSLMRTTLRGLIGVASAADHGLAGQMQPVNLVLQEGQTTWKDPRGPLTQKARELGLSPEEVRRIRDTTGYVICPGRSDGDDSVGSAMLAGNGQVVVTDAHLFIRPDGRRELLDCVFVSHAERREMVKLDFTSDRSYRIYSSDPKKEFYKDRAIVRLKRRITGVKPFPLDLEDRPIRPGDRLIMVSADEERLTFPMLKYKFKMPLSDGEEYEIDLKSEPTAQLCTAIVYYPQTATASSVIYSDCSCTHKTSGSMILVREGGILVAKALHERGGWPAADYKPFKIGPGVTDDELSFSLEVGLDANVVKDILAIEDAN